MADLAHNDAITEESSDAAQPALAVATPHSAKPAETSLWISAADELRRARDPQRALTLYRRALDAEPSVAAGAGAVACLRRLERFDEARELLTSLQARFSDEARLEAEAGWLRFQCEIAPLLEKGMIANATLAIADLVACCRDHAVRRHAVFAAIKGAKQRKKWSLVQQLCALIDPSTLSQQPRGKDGKGWSDRARWTAAQAASLLETDRPAEAITLCELAERQYRDQACAFRRWHARGLALSGRLDEARALYDALCARSHCDWWLRHERAQLMRQTAGDAEALPEFCRAALGARRIEMAVKLLADLASTAAATGANELARATADLTIQLRQRQGWRVPVELCSLLADLGPLPAKSESERLKQCKGLWREAAGLKRTQREEAPLAPQAASGEIDPGDPVGPLHGRLLWPDGKAPFCFIETASERVFCLAADLPASSEHGVRLRFFKIRSLNRKKQKKSWRAVEVTLRDEEDRR